MKSRSLSDYDIININDTDMTTEETLAYIAAHDPIEIRYGNLTMQTERCALDYARKQVVTLTENERALFTQSVDRVLQKALPKIMKGRFSEKTMDDFHSNLLLWTVLKENMA